MSCLAQFFSCRAALIKLSPLTRGCLSLMEHLKNQTFWVVTFVYTFDMLLSTPDTIINRLLGFTRLYDKNKINKIIYANCRPNQRACFVRVYIRTSEVRERLNLVRRRCAEMTIMSSKESTSRPSADSIRIWAQSLDALLSDKCQSRTSL